MLTKLLGFYLKYKFSSLVINKKSIFLVRVKIYSRLRLYIKGVKTISTLEHKTPFVQYAKRITLILSLSVSTRPQVRRKRIWN